MRLSDIIVSENLVIIGSDNGLSAGQTQIIFEPMLAICQLGP